MDKIRINAYKLSSEHFLLRLLNVSESNDNELDFYKTLAARQINIIFLSRTSINGKTWMSCCISSKFHNQVETLLYSVPALKNQSEFIPSVGLVSLFPHRFSLEILGKALNAFGNAGLSIYGFASSISSITFVTDYLRLKDTIEILREDPLFIS